MGLAASQARLLSLTQRQHNIEHRAQVLQANKLRLANDSDAVYEKYIEALDATKLETRTYDLKGKVHWVDASIDNLMRYSATDKSLGNIYYVQDINSGKLHMPKKVVDAYNNCNGDLLQFLDNVGVSYETGVHTQEYINAEYELNYDKANGYHTLYKDDAGNGKYHKEFIDNFKLLRAQVSNPTNYLSDGYYAAQNIHSLIALSANSSGTAYVPSRQDGLNVLNSNLDKISAYTTDSKVTDIINYCKNFNISEIFDNTSNVTHLQATTNSISGTYIYYDKETEDKKTDEASKAKIDDVTKLRLLLSGGTYNKNKEGNKDVYDETAKGYINTFATNRNMTNANPNIGDVLIKIANEIMDREFEKAVSEAETDLNNLVNTCPTGATTVSQVSKDISNYEKYCNDKIDFECQDDATHTKYDDVVLGTYYENMFNAIKSAGGCIESDANMKSPTWVNNMIKNTQVILAIYNEEDKNLDNITPSTNGSLREVTNDALIAQADIEYETALEAINSKDTKYSTELNQLEEERDAIQMQIESLKKIAKENIERTFKVFS